MVISASLHACGVVFPLAMLTSICRSIVTICSGLYLLMGMTRFSSMWILSHSTWYKFCRSRHLHDQDGGWMSLNLPRTHLVGPVSEKPGQTVLAPLGVRGTVNMEQTNLLARMFDKWGEIPVAMLQQVNLRSSLFAYIGREDHTMYPWVRPGSLVQIDSRQRAIQAGGWQTEIERPIYFVELRDSCVYSWCDLDGNLLFLIPTSQ